MDNDAEPVSASYRYANQIRRRIREEEEDALQVGPRKKPFVRRCCHAYTHFIVSAASPTRSFTMVDILVEPSMHYATYVPYSRTGSCVWPSLWMATASTQFGSCIIDQLGIHEVKYRN